MVSCQEPSPLRGSKHSLQCHPYDAALVNAHSFVSMGAEAMCRPCHSAAHRWHMKRQPSLCHCCPCHGRCHCNHHRHLRCRRQLHCHHRRHCPLSLPLPLAIAIAVATNHCCHCLCCVAISRCCCRCPCHKPLSSLLPSSIAVAISVSHHCAIGVGLFQELLPWRGKNCIQTIQAKNAYLILFCSDSGWRTDDQSRMTDQALSSNGQHQRWAASSEQQAAVMAGSRGAAGVQQEGSSGAAG
jgi:hypothetical protein